MFAQPRIKKTTPAPHKKRKIQHKIEEITFDKDARAEYLTGFHKRKVERQKEAKRLIEEELRKAKIETRKQIREERKQAVEEHVSMVHKLLREARIAGEHGGSDSESGEEWGGLSDSEVVAEPLDREEEYIDEDRYTTVTVEAVSVDRDGLHNSKALSDEKKEAQSKQPPAAVPEEPTKEKKEWPKKKPKFRYESKVDRRITERKQKAKSKSYRKKD
ncbi:nucleolar protein 12-domain-containing protein [Podospora didyma]|uniref:Nucleolar protein 12-domain-containing protein n=1 Tax=Podospora didyma TaxID=330526 RepID=A0AAE0KLZ6_9PEZI|nr:nucleolar protein 12-domain-containing protein [Podospora didyma]